MPPHLKRIWKVALWIVALVVAGMLTLLWLWSVTHREANSADGRAVQKLQARCPSVPCVPFPAEGAAVHMIAASFGYVEPEQQNEPNPEGTMTVTVDVPDAVVVLLGSSRIKWLVNVANGVALRKVIVVGDLQQQVVIRGQVQSEVVAIQWSDLYRFTQALPPVPKSDYRNELLDAQVIGKLLTGQALASFQVPLSRGPKLVYDTNLSIDVLTTRFELPSAVGPRDIAGTIYLMSHPEGRVRDYVLSISDARGEALAYSDIAFSKGKLYFEGEVHILGLGTLRTPTNFGACIAEGAEVEQWILRTGAPAIRESEHHRVLDGDVFGMAIDFDRQRSFRRRNGVWLDGSPETGDGLPLQKDREYRICAKATAAGDKGGDLRVLTSWDLNLGNRPFKHLIPEGYQAPVQ